MERDAAILLASTVCTTSWVSYRCVMCILATHAVGFLLLWTAGTGLRFSFYGLGHGCRADRLCVVDGDIIPLCGGGCNLAKSSSAVLILRSLRFCLQRLSGGAVAEGLYLRRPYVTLRGASLTAKRAERYLHWRCFAWCLHLRWLHYGADYLAGVISVDGWKGSFHQWPQGMKAWEL